MAQAKATANKPHAIPTYPASTSRSSAGSLSPEPGTNGSGSACPATGHISVIDDPPSTRPRHAVRTAVIDRRHRRRRSEQRLLCSLPRAGEVLHASTWCGAGYVMDVAIPLMARPLPCE